MGIDTRLNDDNMIYVIFKYGDDLKRDLLISNVLIIMDRLWLSNGLDLKIRAYSAIQTGSKTGFLSIIKHSKQIKKENGINSIFSNSNGNDMELQQKRNVYARSCAGYCVATWILRIASNKITSPNIRIHADGSLFYYNFARFIFDFESDERASFVFNNYMKYALDVNVYPLYSQFVTWIFESFCLLKDRYRLILSCLLFMIPSQQISQINHERDVLFLKEILRFDLKQNNKEEIAMYIEETLKLCLDQNTT